MYLLLNWLFSFSVYFRHRILSYDNKKNQVPNYADNKPQLHYVALQRPTDPPTRRASKRKCNAHGPFFLSEGGGAELNSWILRDVSWRRYYDLVGCVWERETPASGSRRRVTGGLSEPETLGADVTCADRAAHQQSSVVWISGGSRGVEGRSSSSKVPPPHTPKKKGGKKEKTPQLEA